MKTRFSPSTMMSAVPEPTSSGLSHTLKRSFWISLLTIAALLAAVWFGGRGWMERSIMPYSGERALAGLNEEVEILFDERGIPRVHAATDVDALMALGWLHASERLFQMELIRRLTRGELAELVGAAALEVDAMHRSFGFARRIAESPPELDTATRLLIEAYVSGINAGIADADPLPPEFLFLRHAPQPWTVDDVLAVAYYQTWYPTTLVQRMSAAWREVAERYGDDAVSWLSAFPDWKQSTIPAGRMTEASNTWVVSPERSLSGAALHASDPHLEYDIAPGMWYAAGLHSQENLNVLGVTVPGLPFVAMGHNGQIAWAFTVAPVDVFELYRQERHPEDPHLVRGPDGWETMQTRTETFAVRDGKSIERIQHETPRGRVIELDDDEVLVMHWAGFELPLTNLIRHVLAINKAGDFESFRDFASNMGALSVNWSYSDRHGNIGYVQSSPVPVRRHDRYFQVLDAADTENQWDGFHPPDTRPWALNPEQGWLGNANNHAVAGNWDYAIPGFYKHLRMRRITDQLSSKARFGRDDMTAFQLDRISDRALSWKDWLADIARDSGRDRLADDIAAWDGDMTTQSEIAGLFARWFNLLPHAIATAENSPTWQDMLMLTDEWLHAPSDGAPMGWIDRDQVALEAFEKALQAGARPLGAIQHLNIRHPMADNPILNRWLRLSRGPFPVGGDPGSLNVSYAMFDRENTNLRSRAGASMRYVMDWSDPDAFRLNLTVGQSGHPLSPHFDDFLADFLDGTPWIVPWSREMVDNAARNRLLLKPDGR
jgi:penicillin G amidase